MPQYIMAIDTSKCLNCKACMLACQQQNNVPYGQFRNWVRETPSPASATGWSFQPGACMHCAQPLCVDACPTRATWKADDGTVQVDADRCIGCGSCVQACPYDARRIDAQRGVVDKCDYCAAGRAQGLEPACVSVCITRVRLFGDAADPADPVSVALQKSAHSFVESPESPTKPTLTYLGETFPTDWPHKVTPSAPLAFMGTVATGVRWLGALSLFGVVGVFLKQLVLPSDTEPHHPPSKENRP